MSVARQQTKADRPQLIRVRSARVPRIPSQRRIARRHLMVVWTKWMLPLLAVALLGSLAMWPEIQRDTQVGRIVYRRLTEMADRGGRLTDAVYRSVDERGRPYTLTAQTAVQADPEQINLTAPKGDLTLSNGTWLYVQSKHGVYMQHKQMLDLFGDVTLYRDDGTIMHSAAATTDLKAGAAAGTNPVSSEGPFGTLDAQGFAIVDKGQVIQFTGPARLVLNNHHP